MHLILFEVDTAVKFLKNPKVARTAEYAKREFLVKKGMTEAEIQKALEQASSEVHQISNPFANSIKNQNVPNNQIVHHNQINTRVIKPSMWSIVFGWIRNFLVAGCLAYTAYKLIIKVISLLVNHT